MAQGFCAAGLGSKAVPPFQSEQSEGDRVGELVGNEQTALFQAFLLVGNEGTKFARALRCR